MLCRGQEGDGPSSALCGVDQALASGFSSRWVASPGKAGRFCLSGPQGECSRTADFRARVAHFAGSDACLPAQMGRTSAWIQARQRGEEFAVQSIRHEFWSFALLALASQVTLCRLIRSSPLAYRLS